MKNVYVVAYDNSCFKNNDLNDILLVRCVYYLLLLSITETRIEYVDIIFPNITFYPFIGPPKL